MLIVVFGVGLGLLAGLRRGFVDSRSSPSRRCSAAIPSFVAAIVLLSVFAVKLGWLPALGQRVGLRRHDRAPDPAGDRLAASAFAVVVRVTRVTVRSEHASSEHVQTATSRGIPRRLVIRRHVLRNAAIPITTVAGITITSLFALSAVVERRSR